MAVRHALLDLDGVLEATVSYDDQRAVVTYAPDRVEPAAMVAAIERAGFEATVLGAVERGR